jgi:hypothetical protein
MNIEDKKVEKFVDELLYYIFGVYKILDIYFPPWYKDGIKMI